MNGAIFDDDSEQRVLVRGIEFYSLCEHHMLPFFGKCHLAYLPAGKVIGLSKLARLVEIFARRLQVQERMTAEIAKALSELIPNHGVGVVVETQTPFAHERGVIAADGDRFVRGRTIHLRARKEKSSDQEMIREAHAEIQ